jgi:hypothetical protein
MLYSCCLCYSIYVIIILSQHCICIVCVLLKVRWCNVATTQLQIKYSIVNQYCINVYYDVTSNDLGTRLDEDPIKSYETMFSASYIKEWLFIEVVTSDKHKWGIAWQSLTDSSITYLACKVHNQPRVNDYKSAHLDLSTIHIRTAINGRQ